MRTDLESRYRLELSPEQARGVRLDLSADGAHVWATHRDGAIEHGLVDGRVLPPARWIAGRPPPVDWAADRSRRAMVALDGAAARLCVSDAARDVWHETHEDVRLFPGGLRDGDGALAYSFARAGRWWIGREDADPSGPFDEVLALSWRDGALVAVVRDEGEHRVWIDGRSTTCVSARPAVHAAHGALAIVDGAPGAFTVRHLARGLEPALHGPFARSPRVALGAGGRLVLAIAHDRNDTEVRLGDGTAVSRVSAVRSLEGATGPRGDRLAFAYDRAGFAGFHADDAERDGLGYSDGPWWSDDGAHLLWAGERAGAGGSSEAFVVLDERERSLPASIDWEQGSSVRVTPRGQACVFGVDRERDLHYVHVGERAFGPFPTSLEASARRERFELVAFSRDGAHLAFQHAEGDRAFVHFDDEVVGPFPRPGVFTLDPEGALVIARLEPPGVVVTSRWTP